MRQDAPDTLDALIGLSFVGVDDDCENEDKAGGKKTVEIKESMLGWMSRLSADSRTSKDKYAHQ